MRIRVTAKVPPTTTSSEGALRKMTKGPPRLIAAAMMTYASINPTSVAKSTQMLLLAFLPKSKFSPEQNYRYARMGGIGREG
jgi:hypothetical protein